MHVLENLFLRLYGFNLERGLRSSPEEACKDALMQFGMLAVLPLALVLGFVGLYVPDIAHSIKNWGLGLLLVVGVLTIPVGAWVNGRFGHFRNTPGAARAFRSRGQRIVTLVAFVLVPITLLMALGWLAHTITARS